MDNKNDHLVLNLMAIMNEPSKPLPRDRAKKEKKKSFFYLENGEVSFMLSTSYSFPCVVKS
jgi:hypothetical protein